MEKEVVIGFILGFFGTLGAILIIAEIITEIIMLAMT